MLALSEEELELLTSAPDEEDDSGLVELFVLWELPPHAQTKPIIESAKRRDIVFFIFVTIVL